MIAGRNGAAARLGLKRTTLLSKMQKLGVARRPGSCEETRMPMAS